MASVTLSQLSARARERADMVGSTFVTDSADSLWAWINEGDQELYELLLNQFGQEYVESTTTITTASGTEDYSLPADFFKAYGVEINANGKWITLRPYNRAERNAYKSATFITAGLPRYRIVPASGAQPGAAPKLRLEPAPDGAYSVKVYYAPTRTPLATGTDAVNYPNGWERYAILYAAIRCLRKEESETAALDAELAQMKANIVEAANNRDAEMPMQAVDMDIASIDPRWLF